MNIVCYSKDSERCRYFVPVLEKHNCNCIVFNDEVKFLFSLASESASWNVLLLDFQSIPHYSFNIFNYLIKLNLEIPVVFYNDPMAPAQNKALYWKRTNENMYFSKKFDKYSDIFRLIENILDCPVSERPAHEKLKMNLDILRQKFGLTPKMFRLFQFFYKKRGRELSVKELSGVLCEGKELSSESIYTYISRLRKILLKEKLVKIDIVRTAFASYQMIVQK